VLRSQRAAGRQRRLDLLSIGDRPSGNVSERKSFLLRVDPKVHQALEKWAADELRSLNAQIEFLLRRALKESGRLKSD
jgi:hypothetical protein